METRIIAHGLLVEEGRLLLLQRAPGRHLGGQWDPPGGTVESSETPEQGVVREFVEEIGLRVEIVRELIRQEEMDTDKGLLFVTVTYLVSSDGAELDVDLSDEHTDYQWIDLRSALSGQLEVVWHLRPAIKKLLDLMPQ